MPQGDSTEDDQAQIDTLKKRYMKSLEQVVIQSTENLCEAQKGAAAVLTALAEAVDPPDHLRRMREYSVVLLRRVAVRTEYRELRTDEFMELLVTASLVYDIGKIAVPDAVLLKPGPLTEAERACMRRHTEVAAAAFRRGEGRHSSWLSIAELVALHHHQGWDGGGYPAVDIDGEHRPLRGEEIPLTARVVGLADAYDAMTSARPWRPAFTPAEARDRIVSEAGRRFDPAVVDAFVHSARTFERIRFTGA